MGSVNPPDGMALNICEIYAFQFLGILVIAGPEPKSLQKQSNLPRVDSKPPMFPGFRYRFHQAGFTVKLVFAAQDRGLNVVEHNPAARSCIISKGLEGEPDGLWPVGSVPRRARRYAHAVHPVQTSAGAYHIRRQTTVPDRTGREARFPTMKWRVRCRSSLRYGMSFVRFVYPSYLGPLASLAQVNGPAQVRFFTEGGPADLAGCAHRILTQDGPVAARAVEEIALGIPPALLCHF
jgi:hypothetical protein